MILSPQRVFVVLLTPYVVWLTAGYEYHFLDGVNLALHEGGHLIFSPLGQTLQVLGGTIGQLFFPCACVVHFARRGRPFDAAICSIWFGESLMYTATYLGDAQRQALPLVGGHLHDWHFLLSRAGLLAQSEPLGRALHVIGSLAVLAAWGWAARQAFRGRMGLPYD